MTTEELLSSIDYYVGFATQQNADILNVLENLNDKLNNFYFVFYAFCVLFVAYIIHHIFDAVWKR